MSLEPNRRIPIASAETGRDRATFTAGPSRRGYSAGRTPELFLVHDPKRRKTAFLLCLFLGWAGCHRFYVGKRGSGRLYLWTGGLLLLGVLVDLGCILAGSFTDRSGNPLA